MSVEPLNGSCHCGAVSYSVHIDLRAQTFRCNCSICTKSRAWVVPVAAADFTLCGGAEMLAEYRFGRGAITHCFCSRCGIKTHGRLHDEANNAALVVICVSTLEITPRQFAEIPITYVEGRLDAAEHPPEFTEYL